MKKESIMKILEGAPILDEVSWIIGQGKGLPSSKAYKCIKPLEALKNKHILSIDVVTHLAILLNAMLFSVLQKTNTRSTKEIVFLLQDIIYDVLTCGHFHEHLCRVMIKSQFFGVMAKLVTTQPDVEEVHGVISIAAKITTTITNDIRSDVLTSEFANFMNDKNIVSTLCFILNNLCAKTQNKQKHAQAKLMFVTVMHVIHYIPKSMVCSLWAKDIQVRYTLCRLCFAFIKAKGPQCESTDFRSNLWIKLIQNTDLLTKANKHTTYHLFKHLKTLIEECDCKDDKVFSGFKKAIIKNMIV